MRKRLFDGLDQGLGEEILLLDPLPPPGGYGIACSLCWALERLLDGAGQPVSYTRLMGLTGTAFMLPRGEHFAPDWGATEALEHLPPAFLIAAGADEADVLSRCREQLRSGRPLAALDEEGTWVVVVGLRGEELLVQTPGATRPYERCAPLVRSVIALGDVDPGWPTLEASLDALRRAGELLDRAQEQWQGWLEALAQDEPYGPELGRAERFIGEQMLTAAVHDARAAAAEFLAELADESDYELADALRVAAQAAELVVLALEQLVVSPEAMDTAHLAEDEAWLESRREALDEARRRDARLAEALAAATDTAGEFL